MLRKHDRTGRSTSQFVNQVAKLHRPPSNWVWLTLPMLESPALRGLSITARRILDRLCAEHLCHAGVENGRLKVTYRDFEKFGATRELIPAALRQLEEFGWIRFQRGGRWGETKSPSLYTLTWLPVGTTPATNDWQKVTDEGVSAWKTECRERRNACKSRPLQRAGKNHFSGTASRTL